MDYIVSGLDSPIWSWLLTESHLSTLHPFQKDPYKKPSKRYIYKDEASSRSIT